MPAASLAYDQHVSNVAGCRDLGENGVIRQGLRGSCLWELYLADSKSTDPFRSLVCIHARVSCWYTFTRSCTCFLCTDYRASRFRNVAYSPWYL